MVAGRMLEAFSGKCVKDVTTAVLSAGDTDFTVKGAVMKTAGWRAVFNERETGGDEDATTLPPLQEGQTLPLSGVDLLEKQTKPKPLHTESTSRNRCTRKAACWRLWKMPGKNWRMQN